jgi:hypothetical protein
VIMMTGRCRAEIGYAIAANYWGQGICTKAVKVSVSQVFKDIPYLVRIQSFCFCGESSLSESWKRLGSLGRVYSESFHMSKGELRVQLFSVFCQGIPFLCSNHRFLISFEPIYSFFLSFGAVATMGRHNDKMEILLIKATYTLWSLASWSAPIYCLYLLTYTCKLFFSN